MTASCGSPVDWSNCYSGQYDLWAPESYAHPAKGSPALFFRILEHLEELGLLRPGQTVLDPMCGTGTTLLAAAVKGHPAVGVELEPRFVSLAQANVDRIALKGFGAPIRIVQGDARNLSTLLQERGLVAVSSPPYGDAITHGQHRDDDAVPEAKKAWRLTRRTSKREYERRMAEGYGIMEGQIGALPDRSCVITSPPYEDSDQAGAERPYSWQRADGHAFGAGASMREYPQSDGQLGQERGATYLSAMRQVYAEIAKVADVLAIVLKNPTRNGKLRRLDLDSIAVLEATGWQVHCHHHATLFEEQEQTDMFAGPQKKVTGRMSFFKRLSYAKGAPVAQWEDVIVAVRRGQ